MCSTDAAGLGRQWPGARGWQGALARMCPLESTLAGTDAGEAPEWLSTRCQHGREMLSTHCPLGPLGPGAGDPQAWPPQDGHRGLSWHQPIAPAPAELWQSTARARVSPWSPVGAAPQAQGWQGWRLWGAQGATSNAFHLGTAGPSQHAPTLHSLSLHPYPSILHSPSLIPVSLSLACPIPSSLTTTALVPHPPSLPPHTPVCALASQGPVLLPRRWIAAR